MERLLLDALNRLYTEDRYLISVDSSERAICGRLAMLLQAAFDRHSVDVEYNRHGVDPKEIEWPDASGTPTLNRVFPDIIVHRRGDDTENLLVVEVKKSSNPASDEGDLYKLDRIKHALGYQSAAFVRLPVGASAQLSEVRIVWI